MEESYASGLSDLRIVSNDFRLDSRILSQNSKSEFLTPAFWKLIKAY